MISCGAICVRLARCAQLDDSSNVPCPLVATVFSNEVTFYVNVAKVSDWVELGPELSQRFLYISADMLFGFGFDFSHTDRSINQMGDFSFDGYLCFLQQELAAKRNNTDEVMGKPLVMPLFESNVKAKVGRKRRADWVHLRRNVTFFELVDGALSPVHPLTHSPACSLRSPTPKSCTTRSFPAAASRWQSKSRCGAGRWAFQAPCSSASRTAMIC